MQTEVYILQLFVRTRIDLSELKSLIIHVLKSVVNNRGLKSNRFFSINKRLKKIAPTTQCPHTDIIYCSVRVKITRAWG